VWEPQNLLEADVFHSIQILPHGVLFSENEKHLLVSVHSEQEMHETKVDLYGFGLHYTFTL
jgi:hypothetical protein